LFNRTGIRHSKIINLVLKILHLRLSNHQLILRKQVKLEIAIRYYRITQDIFSKLNLAKLNFIDQKAALTLVKELELFLLRDSILKTYKSIFLSLQELKILHKFNQKQLE